MGKFGPEITWRLHWWAIVSWFLGPKEPSPPGSIYLVPLNENAERINPFLWLQCNESQFVRAYSPNYKMISCQIWLSEKSDKSKPLEKVWIQLYSWQLWVNNRADWVLYSRFGNLFRRRKTDFKPVTYD